MLNIPYIFCSMIITCFMLTVPMSGYAGKVTTTYFVEIPYKPRGEAYPKKYAHSGVPGTQLSIVFNGVRAEGYTRGLIVKETREIDQWILNSMSENDFEILDNVAIHVIATCLGSLGSKSSINNMKPGMVLSCNKGEGLQVELYTPAVVGTMGIFTLSKTQDIDDEMNESITGKSKDILHVEP